MFREQALVQMMANGNQAQCRCKNVDSTTTSEAQYWIVWPDIEWIKIIIRISWFQISKQSLHIYTTVCSEQPVNEFNFTWKMQDSRMQFIKIIPYMRGSKGDSSLVGLR